MRDTSLQDRQITNHNPKWIKPAGLIVAGAIVIGLAWQSFAGWASVDHSVELKSVKLATVERGDFIRDIAATGRVVAANAPILYSPEVGLVTLLVKPGDSVEQDQVVAVIDSPQLLSQKQQQLAIVEQLKAEISRVELSASRSSLRLQQQMDLAKVNLEAAEREFRRAEISIKKQLISQIDYEEAQDELAKSRLIAKHAEQDVELAKRSLAFEVENKKLEFKQQQVVLLELERKVGGLSVKSPVKGVVGNWLTEQKNQVQRNQELMKVVDLTAYEAQLQISESYAAELGIGMNVDLTIGGHPLIGVLSAISPEVNNNQVTAQVKIRDKNGAKLRQNQRVNARILLEQKEDVVMIKRGQFYGSGAGKVAYVVNDSIAQRVDLESGSTSTGYVEILAGVNVGDTLVISNLSVFKGKERIVLH
ncbi:efflux RND transporter periplasmic adaptor subunit [Thalassotalea atypica]|uniref:efflux RND transporter periplasmic adaptor subunit n=1 Tax=Thalassotalea atypica TaxID=2054316 RepID=UPI00257227E7|nr:HlyD family efflux transporter periplasmic adaptor subunit [Thalassotalea atypica]